MNFVKSRLSNHIPQGLRDNVVVLNYNSYLCEAIRVPMHLP